MRGLGYMIGIWFVTTDHYISWVWAGHRVKVMLVASIDGGKHILQNDMFKFWEYGRKLATGVQKIADSLKDVKRKRGQKSFWGNFERADSAKVQRYFWNRRSQFEEAVKRLSRWRVVANWDQIPLEIFWSGFGTRHEILGLSLDSNVDCTQHPVWF